MLPELSDLAALEPGLSVGSLARALASGDVGLACRIGKVVPTGDIAVALNTAFMGDGAVIRVAPGRLSRGRSISYSSMQETSQPRYTPARWS